MEAARRSRRPPDALTVVVTDARGRLVRGTGLERWLPRAAPARARGDVAVALVSDAGMRRLNRTHRGVDAVTDVLSFPADPISPSGGGRASRPGTSAADGGRIFTSGTSAGAEAPAHTRGGPLFLGDIVIARGLAARQARRLGHAPAVEWRVLALHGLLHLLGYDHEVDQGQMERLEERLRRRAGLPSGLMARAPGSAKDR
jgi:probable rRNA maturation factor